MVAAGEDGVGSAGGGRRFGAKPRPSRRGALATALALLLLTFAAASPTLAQVQRFGLVTGDPLPRFMSLDPNRVNVRAGPGEEYPIRWIFVRAEYPVEVTQEFNQWRRIRDVNGDEGWVRDNLLSSKRTALVRADRATAPVALRAEPSPTAAISAYLEPGVLAEVDRCRAGWCRLIDSRFDGWIEQDRLWGVYEGEEF